MCLVVTKSITTGDHRHPGPREELPSKVVGAVRQPRTQVDTLKSKNFFNIFFQQALTDGLCQHHHEEDLHPYRRARHHGRGTGETQSNPRTYFVAFSSDIHSLLQVNMANLKDGMQRWLRDHNIKGY